MELFSTYVTRHKLGMKLSDLERQMAECIHVPIPKGVKRLQYGVNKVQLDSRRKKWLHDSDRPNSGTN
jgi:hypothetical protein